MYSEPSWQHRESDCRINVSCQCMEGKVTIHFDTEIAMPKISLALKMYASVKTSKNRYIRNLVSASTVFDPRAPRLLISWDNFKSVQWGALNIPIPTPETKKATAKNLRAVQVSRIRNHQNNLICTCNRSRMQPNLIWQICCSLPLSYQHATKRKGEISLILKPFY